MNLETSKAATSPEPMRKRDTIERSIQALDELIETDISAGATGELPMSFRRSAEVPAAQRSAAGRASAREANDGSGLVPRPMPPDVLDCGEAEARRC